MVLSFLNQIQFNDQGLVPAITQDSTTGEVLMMAWMNKESLELTLQTRQVVYWSRSRQKLWRKGESSGHTQKLISVRTDCDQDALLLQIEQKGPACHTNRRSCFYLEEKNGNAQSMMDPIA